MSAAGFRNSFEHYHQITIIINIIKIIELQTVQRLASSSTTTPGQHSQDSGRITEKCTIRAFGSIHHSVNGMLRGFILFNRDDPAAVTAEPHWTASHSLTEKGGFG
jgi:hypothetical protein